MGLVREEEKRYAKLKEKQGTPLVTWKFKVIAIGGIPIALTAFILLREYPGLDVLGGIAAYVVWFWPVFIVTHWPPKNRS
jgi:hypothetical protein